METGWTNSFSGGGGGDGTGGDDSEGHNCNFTNNAWDILDISTTVTLQAGSRYYDWSNCIPLASTRVPETSVVHALLFGAASNNTFHDVGAGIGPDPHMMCLKLGKRHYCEDAVVPDRHVTAESPAAVKRGRLPFSSYVTDATTTYPTTTVWPTSSGGRVTSSAVVPRCVVEGCHVALANAKEYYRRHKVCEIHSKAPKVVVSGIQQRFCQQCSRFHEVTEFDEAKRSCRRRLEGHNQRRRKGTLSNSLPRNFRHSYENNPMMERRLQPLSHSNPGCALSLLSSPKTEPWIYNDDMSSQCSAALCELIAANRASSFVGHFINQNGYDQQVIENTIQTQPNTQMWNRFGDENPTTMTLDLMQAPAMDFGRLTVKEKSKDPEEWTDYCWSAFGGANVV